MKTVVEFRSVDLVSLDESFERETAKLWTCESLEALSPQLLQIDVHWYGNRVDPVEDVITRPHFRMLPVPAIEVVRF